MIVRRFILILQGLKQKGNKILKKFNLKYTFQSFTIIIAKLEIFYHLAVSNNANKTHTHIHVWA